jgi:hypothetical protein
MVSKEYAGAKGGGGGGGNVSGDSGADENVQNDGEKRLAEEMLLLRASDKAVLEWTSSQTKPWTREYATALVLLNLITRNFHVCERREGRKGKRVNRRSVLV